MTKLCLHDALLATKVSQAHSANAHRAADPEFKVNEHVYPSTAHRRHEHLNGDSKRVAKFMPRFDGPYKIVSDHLPTLLNCQHTLTYTATFHASERNIPNNATLFPSRELPTPAPVHNYAETWEIEHILDRRTRGRGHQYLVRWREYRPEADIWLPGHEVEDTDALDEYQTRQDSSEEV